MVLLIYIVCDHKSLPSKQTLVDCRLALMSRQNIDKITKNINIK